MFCVFRKILRGGWLYILDCLFPKECLACGAEGAYLCGECEAVFRPAYPVMCFGCRKSLGREQLGHICEGCRPGFAFDGLLIAADYDEELVRRLIRSCKYRFVRELAQYLAVPMQRKLENFLKHPQAGCLIDENFFRAVVVPVPLSRRRLKWRGFNQAELLAQALAGFAGLACDSGLLGREHRRPQAKLSETGRRNNLSGAFRAHAAAPPLVILVDDVVTTGATLNECAKELKRAGAEEVWCLVAAKG